MIFHLLRTVPHFDIIQQSLQLVGEYRETFNALLSFHIQEVCTKPSVITL